MKDFIQLQPKYWQILYNQYQSLIKSGLSPQETEQPLSSTLSQTFHTEIASLIAKKMIACFSSSELPLKFYDKVEHVVDSIHTDENGEVVDIDIDYVSPEAQLSFYDINLLKDKLSNEDSFELCCLLVSFFVFARANPHPTNWIKYDRKVIMFLSGLEKKKASEQIILTNRLHNLYNVNMRVVGSTQPIPCFNISWHDDQPLVNTPDNPLIDIGPLEPATIISFVTETLHKKKESKNGKK